MNELSIQNSLLNSHNQQVKIPWQTVFVYLIAVIGSVWVQIATVLDTPTLGILVCAFLLPLGALFLHIICAISLFYIRSRTASAWKRNFFGLLVSELLFFIFAMLIFIIDAHGRAHSPFISLIWEYLMFRLTPDVLVVATLPTLGNALICTWLENKHWQPAAGREDVLDEHF